jgi:hypothetical protein
MYRLEGRDVLWNGESFSRRANREKGFILSTSIVFSKEKFGILQIVLFVDVHYGPCNNYSLAVFFKNQTFFEQGATLEGIANAIAKKVVGDFLAYAELPAIWMIEADDAVFSQGKAFVRREVSRCPAYSGSSIAVAFHQGYYR